MHTDESSKRFRAQLTGGGPGQASRSNAIAALYRTPDSLPLPYMPMEMLTKIFVSIANICVPFGRPAQGPFPEWLQISASITHTHTHILS